MENTFAQKFWKDFELLSLEYIREQYKDTSAKCIHTSFINDGGYDGSLSISLTKKKAPFVHEVLSLIEAKLRTDKNITIHDFAASIIAAYNSSANILYVVSNMNFTDGTRQITEIFSNKVNLKIVLIDGSYLLDWLERKKIDSDNTFISELVSSIKSNNASNNTSLVNSNDTNNEITFTENVFLENIPLSPEKLFGIDAKDAKSKIIPLLSKTDAPDRLVILLGPTGTGKSTIITNVGYELQQNNFLFNILDSANEDSLSVRNIFLWTLKSLWGLDPLKIYTEQNITEFIDLICVTEDAIVESTIKETIREVFLLSNDTFTAQSDLYITYLLRYINIILEKRKGKNRTILAFKNMQYLEQPIFDFVIALIRCLNQNNVGIIIELAGEEATIKAKNDWDTSRKAILHLSQYGHIYRLCDFNEEDAKDYLSENLPGLTDDYYQYIIKYIGLKPVFLKYAVNWLIINEVVLSSSEGNYYTVAKPDDFFDGITPDQNIRIIEDIIYYYQINESEFQHFVIELFEIAVLLDGAISYSLLQELYSTDLIQKLTQILIDTGLFIQTSTGVNTNHELVLIALSNKSLSAYRFSAAKKLYDVLNIIKDNTYVQCKKADLLIAMKKWDEFNDIAFQISKFFLGIGDYTKSIKYLSLCIKYFSKLQIQDQQQLLIIMYYELFSYEKTGQGSSNKKLFEEFQNQIKLVKKITKSDPEIYILALEKLYITRYAKSLDQYEKAKDMLAYAKCNFNQISTELYASICYVYALIEKKYISLNSAIEFLKHEKDAVPDSIELDIEYQSHEAAQYLNSAPDKAILYYKNIIKYLGVSKKYNKNIGHAYVDIMNCYLLLENWIDFENNYAQVLEYLQTNTLYAEEGRLYNLDGLYYWLKQDLSTAEESFQNSQFYFGLGHNQLNSIIAKINYIGLLIELKKEEEAILEFSIASEQILKAYRVLFCQIENTKAYYMYREYIALLVLIKYGHRLKQVELVNKLIERVPIKLLSTHVKQFIEGAYPIDVFSNTCIIHNNIVTLTR
jgi:hypothetical protein